MKPSLKFILIPTHIKIILMKNNACPKLYINNSNLGLILGIMMNTKFNLLAKTTLKTKMVLI